MSTKNKIIKADRWYTKAAKTMRYVEVGSWENLPLAFIFFKTLHLQKLG